MPDQKWCLCAVASVAMLSVMGCAKEQAEEFGETLGDASSRDVGASDLGDARNVDMGQVIDFSDDLGGGVDMNETQKFALRQISTIPSITQIKRLGGKVYLFDGEDVLGFLTTDAQGGVVLTPSQPPEASTYPEQLAQSSVSRGTGRVRQAWLAQGTTRYAHGVLGDAIEAQTLRVELDSGEVIQASVGVESVFEDLVPRIVDMEGDGEDEVMVVRAYADKGAALMVYKVVQGALEVWFETPALGTPNRWLNPVGVADFDGDGAREVAWVQRPHLDGTLQVWRVGEQGLVSVAAKSGFSNHGIGSTELGLSAIVPRPNQGAWMVVPSGGRRAVNLVGFQADEVRVEETFALSGEVVTDMEQVGRWVVFGLDDGEVWGLEQSP